MLGSDGKRERNVEEVEIEHSTGGGLNSSLNGSKSRVTIVKCDNLVNLDNRDALLQGGQYVGSNAQIDVSVVFV